MASRTASAPCPASAGPFFTRAPSPWPGMRGRWSSIVNRVVRSTSVPIAELPSPRMRSPSQCPGTARSSASAGRSLIMTSGATMRLAPPAAPRPWHAQRPPGAQAGRQLAPQRAAALHVERLVDGLVADPHRLIARKVEPQPPGDLLRAPRPRPAPVLPRPVPTALPGTAGPATAAPSGSGDGTRQPLLHIRPQRRVRHASFAGFGRRAARSACHCAVVARYSSPPLRVAALRRSSREIVDAARPSRRATSRTPWPCARQQRDLLALRKRQVPPRERLRRPRKRRWWHAACLPEPAGPYRLRHPHADRRVLARLSCRNHRPEPPPVLTPRHPRSAR